MSTQYCLAPLFVTVEWLLAMAGPFSILLMMFVPIVFLWSVSSRRGLTALALVLLCPFTVAANFGALAWARGDGYMMGTGLWHPDRGTVDPLTRLPRNGGSCMVSGDEWVFRTPYNETIRLLSSLLGPPRGTYDGPIPTEGEARTALAIASTHTIAWPDLARDQIAVGAPTPLTLEAGLGAALLDGCGYELATSKDERNAGLIVRATVWQKRALLLELSDQNDPNDDEHHAKLIVLIDAVRGRQFGYYNEMPCNRLPHIWRPATAR